MVKVKGKVVCKQCGEGFPNTFMLGGHYKKNPSHRPKTYKGYSDQKKANAGQKKISRGKAVQLLQEKQATPVKYCPCCGFNIASLSDAMTVLSQIENKRG